MEIPFLTRKVEKPSNLVTFSRRRSRFLRFGSAPLPSRQTQRQTLRAQRLQASYRPSLWQSLTFKGLGWVVNGLLGAIVVLQVLLRIAYGGLFVLGLVILAIASTLALLASGHVPTGYWAAVWHGAGQLGLAVLVGSVVDFLIFVGVLIVTRISHQWVSRVATLPTAS